METLLVTCSTFPRWKDDTVPSFVYELSKRLAKHFKVIVLAPHSRGAKTFERRDGIKIYRYRYFFERWERVADGAIIPNLKRNPLLYFQLILLVIAQFFATLRIVKKEKVDKIQAHWIVPQGFIAAVVKRITRTPYCIVSHGADVFGAKGFFFDIFKKFTLNNSEKVSAVSSAVKNEIKKLSVKAEVDIIPMGIDICLFSKTRFDKTIKKKYSPKGNILLFIGRLSEKKGVRYLVEAMPDILSEFPNTKLLIIGSGEEERYLKSLASKLKTDRNIMFLGSLPHKELAEYYATADIFVGPSIQSKGGDMEGFGLVFAEAMASNTVTIGTDLPAIRDIIKPDVNAFMVKQKDAKAIAKKVRYILRNPKKSKAIAKKGEEFIKKNFSWKIILEKYVKHLKRVSLKVIK
jgi:glycosyltransferase involved in cell wall biosynthesis